MRRVEVLVASGCTLCPAAVAAAEEACAGRDGVALAIVDIDGDVALERRWRAAIPVVLVDGEEVARYAATAAEIAARLDG